VPEPPFANLILRGAVSTSRPLIGGPLRISMTAVNPGPGIASNVTVREQLYSITGAGLVFVRSTDPGSFDPQTGVWFVDTLAAGEEREIIIDTIVVATLPFLIGAEIQSTDRASQNATANNNVITESDQIIGLIVPLPDLGRLAQLFRTHSGGW
jgi:hypothetical protein